MIKKILIVVGGIFALLFLVLIIILVIAAVKGTALDKESQAYVDEVVPIICADLKTETFLKYSSVELIKSESQEELEKIFELFGKLGKFKEYVGSSGQSNMNYTTGEGGTITGEYVAQTEFENGSAEVHIITVKIEEEWKIQKFEINSQVFLQ